MNLKRLDLRILPKFRDSSSFLYLEHSKIDRDQLGIRIVSQDGEFRFPCAQVAVLMLGPGTSITHAAVTELSKFGCLLLWCGEQGVRFYATGTGETRNAKNLLHQAKLWADPEQRIAVAKRMYRLRFSTIPPEDASIEVLRGMEGKRVQVLYANAATQYSIDWRGRSYDSDDWNAADPVNRALSVANTCLYGICHAGIVSFGFSIGLGFIHTGRMMSFVYDVADFYKMEICVPAAFLEASLGTNDLERRVRLRMRKNFTGGDLLPRIEKDIFHVFDISKEKQELEPEGRLLDDGGGDVRAAQNYGGHVLP